MTGSRTRRPKREIAELTAGYADRMDYFVDQLSLGLARIAAALYPKPVIVRMSDFKTNEYAGLIGGAQFEPKEENPMIGFRGASRYYSPYTGRASRSSAEPSAGCGANGISECHRDDPVLPLDA